MPTPESSPEANRGLSAENELPQDSRDELSQKTSDFLHHGMTRRDFLKEATRLGGALMVTGFLEATGWNEAAERFLTSLQDAEVMSYEDLDEVGPPSPLQILLANKRDFLQGGPKTTEMLIGLQTAEALPIQVRLGPQVRLAEGVEDKIIYQVPRGIHLDENKTLTISWAYDESRQRYSLVERIFKTGRSLDLIPQGRLRKIVETPAFINSPASITRVDDNIIVVYSQREETRKGEPGSKVMRVLSQDRGETWSEPEALSEASQYGFRPEVFASQDGVVRAIWTEKDKIVVRQSQDYGLSFGPPINIQEEGKRPFLARGAHGKRELYIVYMQTNPDHFNNDIMLAKVHPDGGFSLRRILDGGDQLYLFPTIYVNQKETEQITIALQVATNSQTLLVGDLLLCYGAWEGNFDKEQLTATHDYLFAEITGQDGEMVISSLQPEITEHGGSVFLGPGGDVVSRFVSIKDSILRVSSQIAVTEDGRSQDIHYKMPAAIVRGNESLWLYDMRATGIPPSAVGRRGRFLSLPQPSSSPEATPVPHLACPDEYQPGQCSPFPKPPLPPDKIE